MKHTVEIDTVDALLLVQLLHENNLENETDKRIARRLKDIIIEKVCLDLQRQGVEDD